MQPATCWEPITSAAQYFSFIEAAPLAVIYCTAPWCFRCKQVAEKIVDFPGDYAQVKFYSIDLQDCEELGDVLDIGTLPTFLLLKGGAEVERLEGVPQERPARRLAQAIRDHLLGAAAAAGTAGAAGAD